MKNIYNYENTILSSASTLICVMIKTKEHSAYVGREELLSELKNKILKFEEDLLKNRVSPRLILASRYCICAALDEFISLSAWGIQENWAQHSLLSYMHNETWGGERFFIILNEMIKNSLENWQVIELIYVLIALGYEGKYYSFEKNKILAIKNSLLDSIMQTRHASLATPSTGEFYARSGTHKVNENDYRRLLVLVFLFIFILVNVLSFYKSEKLISFLSLYS